MTDDAIAGLIARDLVANLQARATRVKGVYGMALWVDDYDGVFLASLGLEERFARTRALPAYANRPEAELTAPSGLRWSVGDWHEFPDDEFVSEETAQALAPLLEEVQRMDAPEADVCAASERITALAFVALRLARPLDHLPTTPDAIAFVSLAERTVDEGADAMLETVPAPTLQRVFPGWPALAEAVRKKR